MSAFVLNNTIEADYASKRRAKAIVELMSPDLNKNVFKRQEVMLALTSKYYLKVIFFLQK